MAKYLESLIKSDTRFDIIGENNNELTKKLYEEIENDGRIHVVTASVRTPKGEEIFFIRIAMVNIFTDEEICDYAFKVIVEVTNKLSVNQ
ncbi:unnamed protein product [Hymenolepis diminuta]|uniref:Aminotran_5 domain-containing protein n=1 Tax=Hymenolepis diminuta TaxID=6216 RepID=A0A0R3SYX1_HYMDI|nr:unnamed protein product [Hymenolepis diminuta]